MNFHDAIGHSWGVLRLISTGSYSFPATCLRQSDMKSGFGENSLSPEILPDTAGPELFNGAGEQWGTKTARFCLRTPGNFNVV